MLLYRNLGRLDYLSAAKVQQEIVARKQRQTSDDVLLLVEHPHVYTLGRGGKEANVLAPLEVPVCRTDRGGDVTYHGPGQLVGYPLIPLAPVPLFSENDGRIPQADYVGYIRKLEQTLIVALARLGLAAGQRSGLTGVWIQADVHSRCPRCKPQDRKKPAKIAAIGVKVDARGVSRRKITGSNFQVKPPGTGLSEWRAT